MSKKTIRRLTTVISLVVMVVLAVIVVRLTRVQETNTRPIQGQPPREQLTQKPSTRDRRAEQKLVISEPRKKPSLPVSVGTKPAQVPLPQEKERVEEGNLLRENMTIMLAWALEEDFPELNLSESEFQELTETVITIRESMQSLRGAKGNPENAESIIKIRDRLSQAKEEFKRITGMYMEEFILRSPANSDLKYKYPNDERISLENFTRAIE